MRRTLPMNTIFAAISASALLLLGACAGESTGMPQPQGGDSQQQQQFDTGPVPSYDSYVFPDTGGGGQQDAGAPAADTGGGQADASASTHAGCSGSDLRINEVAVGSLDYVVLINNGSAQADLTGYKLEMFGINGGKAVEFTFSGTSVAAGATVYVLEYEKGTLPADVNIKKNIPFYNGPPSAMKPNAVALYDAQGGLVDYWAVGGPVGMPANVSFAPLPWGSFDSKTSSFQRVGNSGACPNFAPSDWSTAALTRN